MERWKTSQGPTCRACLNTLDERSSFLSPGNMITPNGLGTPLKNPQNLTAGCNGNLLIKNGHPKNHLFKAHIHNGQSTNGHHPEKNGRHLNLVKESLCCFKPKKKNEATIEESDGSCGLWGIKPRWLQSFANKKVFLAVFCLTSVLQGMYYTYFVSVLTTIEKLYQIQSKTTGLIMSATEVGQIGGALILSYYGGQGHRPKWIAYGMIVFAIASIFCATPHFMYRHVTNPLRSSIPLENSTTLALREMRTKLCQSNVMYKSTSSSSSLLSFSSSNSLFDSDFPALANIPNDATKFFMYNRTSRSASTDSLLPDDNVTSTFSLPSIEALVGMQDDCSLTNKVTTTSSATNPVLLIFFLSLFFIGIGATAVYTLGIPYIDDNVATRESPLYFGITIGVRIFGPVFGFLLGSFCTSINVNFPFETTKLSTQDPQWVGAWWLGVLIVGAALIFTAFPMMSFPRNLPKPCKHNQPQSKPFNHNDNDAFDSCNGNVVSPLQDNHQCHHCQPLSYCTNQNEGKKKPKFKVDFPSAIKRLLRNEILLYRTASSVLHILPIAGLYTFLPKYLESQFQLTATMANMISGIAGILVMGVGIFASGTFMRKFKPSARFVARWIAISALLYAIGMMILMIFGCPLNKYVGLNSGSQYEDTSQATCNETCSCKPGEFAPICTSEGVTYLSPCLAGCTKVSGPSYDQFVYEDCLCLGQNVTATNGFCKMQCDSLLPYIFVFALFVLVHSTSEVGSMLLTLRCVEPQDKAMALGLIAFAIGLFGNVPCPIIYGAVVDSACLFWEDNCGTPGACRLYDPSKFRSVFHGVTAVIMFMAFLVDIVVWYKAKSIQFQDEDIVDDTEETVPFNETQTDAQRESSV
ncbi:solute carrier organic anion transporter family member 74D-like [Uloborus diversus]|uniref:solute carrier organic anion transporter family member 74D-like n=1 Tax=Uloborus diversus TaxID=327109 RepID=UPI00240A811C|nr:solute carrier organic anion transporter family member 74D-like [Uloborus diversus]